MADRHSKVRYSCLNNSGHERLAHADRLPSEPKQRYSDLDCINAYVLDWGKTPHTATPSQKVVTPAMEKTYWQRVSDMWNTTNGHQYIDVRLHITTKAYYGTFNNIDLWLGPIDKDWHNPLGFTIQAMNTKGHHARSNPQVDKISRRRQASNQRWSDYSDDSRSYQGQKSSGCSFVWSAGNNWWNKPQPQRPAEPKYPPPKRERPASSQEEPPRSRSRHQTQRPNVVEKLHMSLDELQEIPDEPSPTQSDIEDIERETSNVMHAYRDEEDEDEDSSNRRRRRKSSRPPSAPSSKAVKTAATAAGLSHWFGHGRQGGANAESTETNSPTLPDSLPSDQDYSILSIFWNLFLMLMGLRWIWKQLTRPPIRGPIQCMDNQAPKSKAKSKAPFLEPEVEPQSRGIPGPSRVNAGETTDLRPVFHTSRSDHYHLSQTCLQLKSAKDLTRKTLCKTCLHAVTTAEIRRNDPFARGDTRPRGSERDIERFQTWEHASTVPHMTRLWQDAVASQMAEEQLGVTYTSVPRAAPARARGEAALSSASLPKPPTVQPVPITAKVLSPPPKQPPPIANTPSQGSTTMTSAKGKGKTRRGGQCKRNQRKALKEAHNQGLCNHVDAAINETELGARVNMSSRNDMLAHIDNIDNIDMTISAAETYAQGMPQYLETCREEGPLSTEFTPAIEVLARCLQNSDSTFVIHDNMTVTTPLQRYTRLLDLTATLRSSIERDFSERHEEFGKHTDTLSRVNIVIAALKQAKNTLNRTVNASLELERRYNNLRNTLEALFDDQSSENESEGQQEGPPSPSTHRYWDNLYQNALSPSGDESERARPSSDEEETTAGLGHRQKQVPRQPAHKLHQRQQRKLRPPIMEHQLLMKLLQEQKIGSSWASSPQMRRRTTQIRKNLIRTPFVGTTIQTWILNNGDSATPRILNALTRAK